MKTNEVKTKRVHNLIILCWHERDPADCPQDAGEVS